MTATAKPKYQHRVLVVDDYPDAAETACMLFTALGHHSRPALTGTGALEEAGAFKPDIVLVDISLPDISGYEVARELRARHGQALYLAALTGWGQDADRVRALAAGFDQFLLKPATVVALRQVIVSAEQARP